MIGLVFPEPLLSELSSALRERSEETAALALARPVHFDNRQCWRLLVQEVHLVPDLEYDIRSSTEVQIGGQFQLNCENRARKNGWSIVYCHSHPLTRNTPSFSSQDDRTEAKLASYLEDRLPNVPHLSLLVGAEAINCRALGSNQSVRVMQVGRSLTIDAGGQDPPTVSTDFYDRQILAFEAGGQNALQMLRVGVVGLGGTGSAVAQQLAYLGVIKYTLIDRDDVGPTNLNRLIGANAKDIGKTKVSIARRMISTICPNPEIDSLEGDVVDEGCAQRIAQSDIVFCCTDSHASRHLLNSVSYQYYIPCIDMGVVLTPNTKSGTVDIAGRVNMLSPGLPCLTCLNALDPDLIRKELLNAEQRNADPYFSDGVGIQQPAVVSLTSTVASLAITMFLGVVTGIPANARGQYYDGNLGRVRPVTMNPHPTCITCSSEFGVFGRGQAVSLPTRRQ